jgi:hypothetical protein
MWTSGELLFVFDPYELGLTVPNPRKGVRAFDATAGPSRASGRKSPVETRGPRRGAHPWTPPRPRHVAADGRRCEQPYRLRQSGRHGAVLLVAPRAHKDRRHGHGVRGCGLWQAAPATCDASAGPRTAARDPRLGWLGFWAHLLALTRRCLGVDSSGTTPRARSASPRPGPETGRAPVSSLP